MGALKFVLRSAWLRRGVYQKGAGLRQRLVSVLQVKVVVRRDISTQEGSGQVGRIRLQRLSRAQCGFTWGESWQVDAWR